MGRKKTYDEAAIIQKAREAFLTRGYEGTSIDDLVKKTGLLRGSLYAAYASKRGIFLAVLKQNLQSTEAIMADDLLDLLLIALLELAPRDHEIRQLLAAYLNKMPDVAKILGQRLISRAGINL